MNDEVRTLKNQVKNIPQPIKKNIVSQIMKSPVYDNMYSLLYLQQVYDAGIKEVKKKLEILDAEFKVKYDHNPIHHIESRLKKPESILQKAVNKDIPLTEQGIMENIHDIAGIRVICNYVDDVYLVAQLLTNQDDIQVIEVKDYIQNPKPSGYRSLHLVVEIPIFLAEGAKPIHVEVQLRTIAMDFWASLEHKLKYKTDNNVSAEIKAELQECAQEIAQLDKRMQKIHNQLRDKE